MWKPAGPSIRGEQANLEVSLRGPKNKSADMFERRPDQAEIDRDGHRIVADVEKPNNAEREQGIEGAFGSLRIPHGIAQALQDPD